MRRTAPEPRLGILHEHPDWFRPLFAELDRRGVPFDALRAADLHLDPGRSPRHTVVLNRMSPSAYLRGGTAEIFWTGPYLGWLERSGVRVINGSRAWQIELSKARQLSLLEELGLPYPNARVVHDPGHAPRAADGLRFPVAVKPNVGGSGAGVRRFDTADDLAAAAGSGELDLGIDHVGLVQEFVPARNGRIVRVEVLDGRFLYAIRVYTSGETFDLCPADLCRTVDGTALERPASAAEVDENGLMVEAYEPPPDVVADVERITAAAGIEVGGVEYMIDDRDGRVLYYDVNALSNFVADGRRVLGFDPFARMADWLEREIDAGAAGLAAATGGTAVAAPLRRP